MTQTPKWHQFRDTEDGDDQCARPGCRVVVTLEAHMTFTHPCPVPMCTSPKNPDDGCLMTAHRDGASRCLYCGRSGRAGDRDDEAAEDTLDEEVERELEADALEQLLATFGTVATGNVLEFALTPEDPAA